jgi:hypothetical protein
VIMVISLLMFLSGCSKDVAVSDILDSIKALPPVPVDREPSDGTTRVENQYPGLALMANQVLGTGLTPQFKSRLMTRDIKATNDGYTFTMDEKPLSDDLANAKFTKQLVTIMVAVVDGKKDVGKINLGAGDFRKFIEAAFSDIESLYSDGHAKAQIGRMYGKERVLTRQGMLFTYVKAYLDVKFVYRSGDIISKPSISGTGVPNATVTGLLNVFLEAFYDYALAGKSPVLYQKDKIITYVPFFVPDPQNSGQFIQKFKEIKVNDWFTSKNNQPTAVDFVPLEEVQEGGIVSPQKVRLMRYVSNLAGEKSKALSGIIFRAFGSIDVGLVVFGKFNIGDNELLAKLLDTSFEVSTKRLMELAAYQLIKRYDFGSKDIDGLDNLLMGFEK